MGMSAKMNVIAWLSFERNYYSVVVQYVNHNAQEISPAIEKNK